MIAFSVNGGSFTEVVDGEKVAQYITGIKRDRLQAEWGADWLIAAYERTLAGGELMSLYAYAKNYEMTYGRRETKRFVPIVTSYELAEASSGGASVVGVSENMLPAPATTYDYATVLNDMTRGDVVRDWSKLVGVISVLEGIYFVSLLNCYMKDKSTRCCGRVAKREVRHSDGVDVYKLTTDEQLGEFELKYTDMENGGYSVYVCNCKSVRARRAKRVRDLRLAYKMDALLLAVLTDPVTAQMCLSDPLSIPASFRYQFENTVSVEYYETIKAEGFGDKDYY